MNKEWVNNKKKIAEEKFNAIQELILNQNLISPSIALNLLKKIKKYNDFSFSIDLDLKLAYFDSIDKDIDFFVEEDYIKYKEWIESSGVKELIKEYGHREKYSKYLDGDPMNFDGDIIITDPCYIIRDEHHGTKPLHEDDWGYCEYGENMEALGINNYICRDTLYGDWSCTTYDLNTKKPIGEFCADAGMVAVFDLKEVLEYNPDFDYHLNKKWTTTLIKNFKGTVQFVVEEDGYGDYEVKVIGHGINKITGKPIDFVGQQTGF